MKILYIHGNKVNNASEHIIQVLQKMGHEVLLYSEEPMMITMLDDDIVRALTSYIQEQKVELILSVHFIMGAALAAYHTNLRYAAILWDAPYTEIYNVLGRMNHIWVSTFDRIDKERLEAGGIKHVLYQPLCVNAEEMTAWNRKIQDILQGGGYIHDISFVGRLYEHNLYDENFSHIPANLEPYFNGIFEDAAFKWDGVNRVYGEVSEEILRYMKMLDSDFPISNNQDISDARWFEIYYLIRKIANIERIATLNLLAERYSVTFYTDSEFDAAVLQNVDVKEPIFDVGRASLVYAGSKINLNISLKGIEGGTPLRIMDVMGAGGFVLSSYCAETAEIFEEDKEIVMFKTPEELIEKTEFYLAHDKEREQIARAGQRKVLSCYTYEKKIKQLLDWIAEDEE